MSDIERLLKDSLKSVADDYRPDDAPGARQRFLRRRRRRNLGLFAGGAALAGAAAVLAFLAYGSVEAIPERDVPVASRTTDAVISARIEVGSEPSGIASGAGYVWVANSGNGTVSAVDPVSNEVVREVDVPFEGDPDDVVVAEGWVWVVSDAGEYARIEPDKIEVDLPIRSVGGGGHLDIAAGTDGDVWLLESGGDAYQIEPATGDVSWRLRDGDDPTDVSSSDGTVWIYDRDSGDVVGYDVATREELGRTHVGESESQDLSAGDGYTWFYRDSDGMLLQIEQATGTIIKEYPLGGTFAAISIGPEGVYALVVDGGPSGSGTGRLYQFDAVRATRIGKTVSLADLPFDITWGEGAIWTTNNSGDAVTKIDLVPKGTTTVPEPPDTADSADVVFYYAAGGDIYAYEAGGDSEPVVATEAFESSPTVAPDGSALIYQRGEGANARVVYRALTADAVYGQPGDETMLVKGEAPSFGPDGRLAWAVLPKRSATTNVAVGTPGTDDRIEFPVDSGLGPYVIDRIEWTSDGRALVFHASYEWDSIYRAELPDSSADSADVVLEEITPSEEGAAFVSPAVGAADTVALVRLCCGSYPEWGDLTTADLGIVENGSFVKSIGLDDLGWEPSFDLAAYWAEGLDFEKESGWSPSDKATWFVSTGEELWLVDIASREIDSIGIAGVEDIALTP